MICNNCGTKISDDSKFCFKCGNSTSNVVSNTISNTTQSTCINCGNKIPNGAKFCDKCGHEIDGTTSVNKNLNTDTAENGSTSTNLNINTVDTSNIINDSSNDLNTDSNINSTETSSNDYEPQKDTVGFETVPKQSVEQNNNYSQNMNLQLEKAKNKNNTLVKIVIGCAVVIFILIIFLIANKSKQTTPASNVNNDTSSITNNTDTTTDANTDNTDSNTSADTNTDATDNTDNTDNNTNTDTTTDTTDNTDSKNNDETAQTKTFTSIEEGIFFRYPKSWNDASFSMDGLNLIVGLSAPIDNNFASNMLVYKVDVNIPSGAFDYKSLIKQTYSQQGIEVEDITDTTIDGVDAMKIRCVVYDSCASIQYLYNANNAIYQVSFTTLIEDFDKYEPIFDSIMDTYTIIR